MKTIKAKDPVREAFAGCSSSNSYYETKGHALSAFERALNDHGYCTDADAWFSWSGDEGREILDVWESENDWADRKGSSEPVGRACISWYRMPSGRYEFTGYLA